jgi:hypothetical protein
VSFQRPNFSEGRTSFVETTASCVMSTSPDQ